VTSRRKQLLYTAMGELQDAVELLEGLDLEGYPRGILLRAKGRASNGYEAIRELLAAPDEEE
jgi:hypothetical protein